MLGILTTFKNSARRNIAVDENDLIDLAQRIIEKEAFDLPNLPKDEYMYNEKLNHVIKTICCGIG